MNSIQNTSHFNTENNYTYISNANKYKLLCIQQLYADIVTDDALMFHSFSAFTLLVSSVTEGTSGL